MKKLASYLKRYTKESILAPLFKLLEVVFDLMVPLVVARMINIGVAGNDRGYMVRCFRPSSLRPRPVPALRQTCGRRYLTISRASPLRSWIPWGPTP